MPKSLIGAAGSEYMAKPMSMSDAGEEQGGLKGRAALAIAGGVDAGQGRVAASSWERVAE